MLRGSVTIDLKLKPSKCAEMPSSEAVSLSMSYSNNLGPSRPRVHERCIDR